MTTYYGSGDDIRNYHLSGGVAVGHPQYQDATKVSPALITKGQKFAYDKINSMLRGRFTVPFVEPFPPLINEYADTIAGWWIQNKRMPHLQAIEDNPLNTEYAEAIKHLEEIAKTGVGLTDTTPKVTRGFHSHQNRTPIFNVDGEFDQQVDSDLEDDISASRV